MKALLLCFALIFPFTFSHAAETGVRIRFGLTDQGNTKWDGTVSVTPGRVDQISGWRFQQSDAIDGTTVAFDNPAGFATRLQEAAKGAKEEAAK